MYADSYDFTDETYSVFNLYIIENGIPMSMICRTIFYEYCLNKNDYHPYSTLVYRKVWILSIRPRLISAH